MVGKIVTLINGKKGLVVGQIETGEYMLASGYGGQITYFKYEEILEWDFNKVE